MWQLASDMALSNLAYNIIVFRQTILVVMSSCRIIEPPDMDPDAKTHDEEVSDGSTDGKPVESKEEGDLDEEKQIPAEDEWLSINLKKQFTTTYHFLPTPHILAFLDPPWASNEVLGIPLLFSN